MFEKCSTERLGSLYMPAYENCCLLGHDIADSIRKSPTFRENLLFPSSLQKSKLLKKTSVQVEEKEERKQD